jgi:ABC-type glycerol-3-phosphate transport system substrate-binding protein
MTKRRLLFSLLLVILVLAACAPTANWQDFTGPEGDFTVMLPGIPKDETQQVESDIGEITVNLFQLPFGNFAYVVAYSDYPMDVVQSKGAQIILDGARDGAVTNTGGTLLEEQDIEIQGYPGRQLKVKSPDGEGIAQARMYLVGNRLYQIFVASPTADSGSPDIPKYLESFRLNP